MLDREERRGCVYQVRNMGATPFFTCSHPSRYKPGTKLTFIYPQSTAIVKWINCLLGLVSHGVSEVYYYIKRWRDFSLELCCIQEFVRCGMLMLLSFPTAGHPLNSLFFSGILNYRTEFDLTNAHFMYACPYHSVPSPSLPHLKITPVGSER